jgi:hypothetical protein
MTSLIPGSAGKTSPWTPPQYKLQTCTKQSWTGRHTQDHPFSTLPSFFRITQHVSGSHKAPSQKEQWCPFGDLVMRWAPTGRSGTCGMGDVRCQVMAMTHTVPPSELYRHSHGAADLSIPPRHSSPETTQWETLKTQSTTTAPNRRQSMSCAPEEASLG